MHFEKYFRPQLSSTVRQQADKLESMNIRSNKLIIFIALFAVSGCTNKKEPSHSREVLQNSSQDALPQTSPPSMDSTASNSLINLDEYTLFTYPRIENVWTGPAFSNDTSTSQFRLVTRIFSDYRTILHEKSDTSSSGYNAIGRPINFKTTRELFLEKIDISQDKISSTLSWNFFLDFEPFEATDPEDIHNSVSLEKWKSPQQFVLAVGSSRFLIDASKYPRDPEINVIDADDRILNAPRVDW